MGDQPQRVRQNRSRALRALEIQDGAVFEVWQTHSARVVRADGPRNPQEDYYKADAIVTDRPGLALLMRFADCVPIFLFDPVKLVVGLAHAGWKGTLAKIASRTVDRMVLEYGSDPKDIRAGIGPSIGPDHYEIGPEVIQAVEATFSDRATDLLLEKQGRVHFDLWRANQILLQDSGLASIEVAEICTGCQLQTWYSHRVEGGSTGRFGALIAIKS